MTSRIEVIGDATLYLGDAREVLPTLPPCKLLVVDPPYLLTSGGKSGLMRGIFDPATYANDGKIVAMCEFSDWMPLAFDALADDADAYVMANDKNQFAIQAALLEAGFKFHNLLVWNKVNAVANRWYMKNCEFTVYSWKGKAATINDPSSKQLITCPQIDEGDHPTEKPVPLMEHYISNSSKPGDLVLDPFMGSGTTGVSAVRLGRAFAGIEIDEKHFATACRRIEAAKKTPGFDFAERGAA